MIKLGDTEEYYPFSMHDVHKKWAYFPRRSSSRKWIWFETYYKMVIYFYNDDLSKETVCHKILTKNEYLLWQFNN